MKEIVQKLTKEIDGLIEQSSDFEKRYNSTGHGNDVTFDLSEDLLYFYTRSLYIFKILNREVLLSKLSKFNAHHINNLPRKSAMFTFLDDLSMQISCLRITKRELE